LDLEAKKSSEEKRGNGFSLQREVSAKVDVVPNTLLSG
jgi:hypothetical protein